jgi:galactokinase
VREENVVIVRAEAYAPGRVELLGNHTDYNAGLVLGAAIDRGLTVTGQSRDDGLIRISSTKMGSVEIRRAELSPQMEHPWSNYVLGVVSELDSLGLSIPNFSARIDGDLPPQSGLASSAALEVATAFFLLKLSGAELPPLQIAKLCQRVEHDFVGVQSGLLDQVCSIFGREKHAVFFDAGNEEVQTIPFPRGFALLIAESGSNRELAGGLYNQRHKETQSAADALGIPTLRDVSRAILEKSNLPPVLLRRAAHIVGENERVLRALDLLSSDDGRGLGALMNESHESSRTNFENSTPQLDLLVDIARTLPGVCGARLTGGGFGGAIVALCEQARATAVGQELARDYANRMKAQPQILVCRIANGAH